MNQIATPSASQISQVSLDLRNIFSSLSSTALSKEVIVLGLILAALQVMDGILTGIGVSHLGTEVEGNLLIRNLMEMMGYIPALLVVKGVALAVILGICLLSSRVSWLSLAMKAIIFIYLGAAVVPWTFVIARHIL